MANVIEIDAYTGTWDDATACFGGGLEKGDVYRVPANSTPDGREADAFQRRVREAGLTSEYSHAEEDDEGVLWDYYELAYDRHAVIEPANCYRLVDADGLWDTIWSDLGGGDRVPVGRRELDEAVARAQS